MEQDVRDEMLDVLDQMIDILREAYDDLALKRDVRFGTNMRRVSLALVRVTALHSKHGVTEE